MDSDRFGGLPGFLGLGLPCFPPLLLNSTDVLLPTPEGDAVLSAGVGLLVFGVSAVSFAERVGMESPEAPG